MVRSWLVCVAVGLWALASSAPAAAQEPFHLKVLFAGDLKSDRTKDFQTFLKSQFSEIGLADYLTLTEAETKKYDVILLDWPEMPPPRTETNGTRSFIVPKLGPGYDRPTILIGGGSLGVGRHFQLKVDDLCVCLADAAYGMQTAHTIFHKPYEVRLALENRPTPAEYRSWPEGEHFGASIKVWKVQERGWSLDKPDDLSVPPGMVADSYGFTDSPDAEIIAAGINTKCPDSVAIGRQANFLLWGFYGSPSNLTAEARKCFVNAICYIKQFDGQKPLVHKPRGPWRSRRWGLAFAFYFQSICDRKQFLISQPAETRNDTAKIDDLHRLRMEQCRGEFPKQLQQQFGSDPRRYVEYYRDNIELLFPTETRGVTFTADEDVKALGPTNRSITLLERCISMLEQGDRPDLALRVLKRYTTESLNSAPDWKSWLDAHRSRLYFTDIGGFKFLVAPESLVPASKLRGENGVTPEPDAENPVVATAELHPVRVRPGEELELVVRIKVAPVWHIYSIGKSGGPGMPTTLKLMLPKGIEAKGEWALPDPIRVSDGQTAYEGAIEFRRRLRVAGDCAVERIDVACELGYQTCNAFSCQLPTRVTLRAKGEVSNGAETKR
jgi:Disulphide bond corrector protein DsbC